LFGADKEYVHSHAKELNADINRVAVPVAPSDSYYLLYRGSTMTNAEVDEIYDAYRGSSSHNRRAAYALLHGKGGVSYPPSFSSSKDIAKGYAKLDQRKWPEHVNTVSIELVAKGPHQNKYGEKDSGVLGVTSGYHPYGSRHEIVLDNRNSYEITKYKLRGNHLTITIVGSAEPPKRRRANSTSAAPRPAVGTSSQHANQQRMLHDYHASQPQRQQTYYAPPPPPQRQQTYYAPPPPPPQRQHTYYAPPPPPPQRQHTYFAPPPPPQPVAAAVVAPGVDPRRVVIPPGQPFHTPPGYSAHIDRAGYTRFLPITYAQPKKKFFGKIFGNR
jgi:hypothetical protein